MFALRINRELIDHFGFLFGQRLVACSPVTLACSLHLFALDPFSLKERPSGGDVGCCALVVFVAYIFSVQFSSLLFSVQMNALL